MRGEGVTRRTALRLLAAAGLAPLGLAGAGCGSDGSRRDPLVALVDAPVGMARLGRLWIDGQSAPPELPALVASLVPGDGLETEAVLRRELAVRLRDDWVHGRTELVNGYTLGATEVRLYALAERLRERGELAG